MKSAQFILLLLVAIAASKPSQKSKKIDPKIIGGDKVEPHSQPWIVSMDLVGDELYSCMGILISQNYVLTSGSCSAYAVEGVVHLGLDNNILPNRTNTQKVTASKFITHPDYNSVVYQDHNIGLVELEEPVELNDFVKVANLIRSSDGNDFVDDEVELIAWDDDGDVSKVTTTIVPIDKCDDWFHFYIYDGSLCVDNHSGDGCGSSGAPFFYNGTVVGLHSLSISGCYAGFYAVAEQILPAIDWIIENSDL